LTGSGKIYTCTILNDYCNPLVRADEPPQPAWRWYPKTVVDLIASNALLEANVIINMLNFNAAVNECQMSQEKLCVMNDH